MCSLLRMFSKIKININLNSNFENEDQSSYLDTQKRMGDLIAKVTKLLILLSEVSIATLS